MKKVRLVFLCFITGVLSYAQNDIERFLDSLQQLDKVKTFEKSIGSGKKAKELKKQIDTTKASTKQIDLVLEYYTLYNPTLSDHPFPLLLWAKKSSQVLNYKSGLFSSLLQLGDAHRFLFKDKEFGHYEEALQLAIQEKNQTNIAKATSKLALQNMAYRDYNKAITLFFEALDIYKEIDTATDVKRMYHCLGDCYMRIDEFENAIKYLELSESISTDNPDSGIDAMNKGFLGELYLKEGNTNKALELLRTSNAIIETKGVVPYLRNYNLLNLGTLKENENDWKTAQTYYKKAFELSYRKSQAVRMQILTATKWANVLNLQKKFNESLILLNHVETRKIAKENSKFIEVINSELAIFYDVLAKTYDGLNDYENGYKCRVKQIAYSKKANEVEIKKNATELEKKYQSQLDQQEIQLLTDENIIKQRNFIITLLSLAGVVSLLVFGFIYARQRSKALQRKAELTTLALEAEQIKAEKLENEKQIANLELELKQRELTTNSISLLQKKEQFEGMAKALKELKPLVSSDQKASSILSGIISDCIASRTTYNWEEFKLTFEKVHPEFYNKILKAHPNLSPNEKKICAFLKLGLNSKDISSITNQSNRTIVIARSRLRKKLALEKTNSLANYVSSF